MELKKANSCLRLFLAFLILVSLFAVYSCERKSPEKVRPASTRPQAAKSVAINLKETKLAAIPKDYDEWGNVSFSADGQQVLYTAKKKDKNFVVVATTKGEQIGRAYDAGSFLIKSPNGRRFAFGGRKGKKKHLVVDNKELRGVSDAEVAPDAFSPDGRLIACEVGGPKDKNWFIYVTDGMRELYRSPVYPDTYRRASFSPDGRLLVYELGDDKRSAGNKKRTVFFVDVASRKIIKERSGENYITAGKITLSSDSSRAIYGLQKEGKKFLVLIDLVLGEERQVEFPFESARDFILSPDGETIVYIANKEGRHILVVCPWGSPSKGKEQGPYEGIVRPTFASDGSTVVYYGMNKGKWRSVVGYKEGPKYDRLGEDGTIFSPDGSKLAYAANKGGQGGRHGFTGGKWFVVVADSEDPDEATDGPGYDMVISPVFSPDNRRIAYRARKGPVEKAERFIVVADATTGKVIKEGPVGDEIWPPVWSADSKSVGYGARIGRELWWKVETLP